MVSDIEVAARPISIPWFGARKAARRLAEEAQTLRAQLHRFTELGNRLVAEIKQIRAERDHAYRHLEELGALSIVQLELKRQELQQKPDEQSALFEQQRTEAAAELNKINEQLKAARRSLVETDELSLLQEVHVYNYRHRLADAVAYRKELDKVESEIRSMSKKDGGAVLATTHWTVNGSASEGRAMVRDFSKLMLRAFNAEADTLVRELKPYKLENALDRLKKTAETIARLGKTMNIRISDPYYQLRARELELTADYLEKEEEQKEAERAERTRMREERKVQQEIERERGRLEKERQHYANALEKLIAIGDEAGATRLREQLADAEQAVKEVDYRAENLRAGYVYVVSNIGSFGERMIKVGMTRRLDPMDRIRELSDASVPFNFDVHALFFSKDAVGIEAEMHRRLAEFRVNTVNYRREFFRATPLEVRDLLSELAGELLQFHDVPEALEYRQSLQMRQQQQSDPRQV